MFKFLKVLRKKRKGVMNEEKAESWIYKLKFQRSYEPKNYRFQKGEKLNAKMDDTIGR